MMSRDVAHRPGVSSTRAADHERDNNSSYKVVIRGYWRDEGLSKAVR